MSLFNLEDRLRDPEYWTALLQLELFQLLKDYMDEEQISQNKLADRLGVSKGYLSQVLNGNFDHRLSKLVSLAMAVGKVPSISYRDIKEVIRRSGEEGASLRTSYVTSTQPTLVGPTPTSDKLLLTNTARTNIIFNDAA